MAFNATSRTLLSIVQEVARRHGLAIPTSVVESTNETVQQLLGLANETVGELTARYKWNELVRRYTFNHAGAGTGALVLTGATSPVPDWRNMVEGTLSCTDVNGVVRSWLIRLTDKEWEYQYGIARGSQYYYRFFGNMLHIIPVPESLINTYFSLQYYSNYPIQDNTGGFYGETFQADNDVCLLPVRLVTLGLRWRYKKEKGLPYAEDKDTYEMEVADYTSVAGHQRPLVMDSDERGPYQPGIWVSDQSWPLP